MVEVLGEEGEIEDVYALIATKIGVLIPVWFAFVADALCPGILDRFLVKGE